MLKYVAGVKPGKKLPTSDRKSANDYEKSRKHEFQEKWLKISDEGEATSVRQSLIICLKIQHKKKVNMYDKSMPSMPSLVK